jgi:hypothetical protein
VKCETVERKRKGTNEVEPQDSGKPWTGMASVDRDPEYFEGMVRLLRDAIVVQSQHLRENRKWERRKDRGS